METSGQDVTFEGVEAGCLTMAVPVEKCLKKWYFVEVDCLLVVEEGSFVKGLVEELCLEESCSVVKGLVEELCLE